MVAVSLAWSGAVAGAVPAGLARAGARRDGALKLDEQTIGLLIETVARDKDRDAFAALFRHFAPRLRALGIRGGATPESAEELAQETMIAVWRKAPLYDQRQASGSTWIFTIMRNKRIDLFRAERRPEAVPEEMGLAVPDAHDVEKSASANEVAAELRRRLDALPRDQAAVLRKAYLEDKTHDAIARELQIPLGTVKSRIRLAIERLRTSMAGMNR